MNVSGAINSRETAPSFGASGGMGELNAKAGDRAGDERWDAISSLLLKYSEAQTLGMD